MTEVSTAIFDENANINDVNLQGPTILLIYRPTCPHCVHYHPEFVAATGEAEKNGIKLVALNTDENSDFFGLKNSSYEVRGVPMVVGYNKGKYVATYDRSSKDLVGFGKKLASGQAAQPQAPPKAEIEINDKAFDEKFDLKPAELKGKVVLLLWRPTCPHCVHFHPEFSKAAAIAKKAMPDCVFLALNTDQFPQFLRGLSQSDAEFKVRGVPTVLSFLDGKYWSTYGPGPDAAGAQKFRTAEDVLDFASGIGSAEITFTEDD